jgi:PadR family transcriptional regulator, regulatory protein PadR
MGRKRRRISSQTAEVLELVLAEPGRWHYGLEVIRATGIASGSAYPILIHLEENGVLESEWEAIDERLEGRRRRRLYRLDPRGADLARDMIDEYRHFSARRSLRPSPREVPA